LLTSGWVHRIYLDEVQETSQSGFGLGILKLASTPKSQTIDKAIQLADRMTDQMKVESRRGKFLALIEFIVISKLPDLTREEFGAMLNLSDYKKSRVYKETWAEATEATREATLVEVIGRMSKHGIPPDNIAKTLEMEVAVVKKILKKKPKK
jgi:predicted transposase YdaD